MNNTIYCFWTGTNLMSDNRKRCVENLREVTECNVVLVTPDNLSSFILDEAPLHEAYQYLSETHKADYLRTYFMNFYGGGYSDIKCTTGSWKQSFVDLETSDKWIVGYAEIEGGVAYGPRERWTELIGNCAYIAKKNTPLTNAWYNDMIELLTKKLDSIKEHPATFPQDCYGSDSGYPLGWNEMLGRIFHRVTYDFKNKVLNTLPISIFSDYR